MNDFEPAVTESAQSISVTAVLLAVMLIVSLGPHTTGQTLLSKKGRWRGGGVCNRSIVDDREFSGAFGHRGCSVKRVTAERAWGWRLARNRIDHDQDDERRVLRFVGDRWPIAFP